MNAPRPADPTAASATADPKAAPAPLSATPSVRAETEEPSGRERLLGLVQRQGVLAVLLAVILVASLLYPPSPASTTRVASPCRPASWRSSPSA